MIIRKSAKDIERIARSGELLASTHEQIAAAIEPGITTLELDRIAEEHIVENGGVPTFKGYRGFPGSICSSPNDMIVHGIPGPFELREGDLISIDCGVTLNGWVSDCARSYVVGGGDANAEAQRLIDVAYESLDAGVAACEAGQWLGDVSAAIQEVVEAAGFGVVRKLVGHGIGRNMHEDPQIPNFGAPGTPPKLEPGFVFAIEPMITVGEYDIREADDGWSIFTTDGSLAAHVEHTVAVTEDGPRVLTLAAVAR
jgi:methionyl aminopeptidase